jgi:hypothetical protein
MSPNELAYYRNRARIERDPAANSANPDVAKIHQKLAALYERLIDMEEQRPTLSIVA